MLDVDVRGLPSLADAETDNTAAEAFGDGEAGGPDLSYRKEFPSTLGEKNNKCENKKNHKHALQV